MKFVEWSMQGVEAVNCNCAPGCPCQFNQDPTHGNCNAYGFVQIEKGRFGDVTLDGLRWGIVAAWPGAIHEGNGTFQTIIDEHADAKQRSAIEAVSHGKETEPGSLIWQVFSTTVTKYLPTLYKPIDLTIDWKTKTARVTVAGIVEGVMSPIKNPVTGVEHVAQIVLPNGFEFTEAHVINGKGKTTSGPLTLTFDNTHAQIARIHWTTRGVVRPSKTTEREGELVGA
jgi:hypothetical protein